MRYAAIFIGVEEGRRMRPEHWLFTIPLRLRSLFHWAQADQELDDELRDHLARKTEEYVVQGMTQEEDRKSTRLNSSHGYISYAVFCLKKKNTSINTSHGYNSYTHYSLHINSHP